MTIDRHIFALACPNDDGRIRVSSADPQFSDAEFYPTLDIPPSPPGAWDNYVKAAVQALNHKFHIENGPGMTLHVGSTLPAEAGLSSSSALVITAALAYLRCLGKSLGTDTSRTQLAALLAEGEHYVGTQGGGMDQAIILLGKEGAASKIDFFPLRIEDLPLFRDHTFVVCNTFVRAPKTGAARAKYNEGPITARLICAMIEKYLQDQWDDGITVERLGDLWLGHLCLTDREVEDLFSEVFPFEYVSLHAVSRFLAIPEDEVKRRWLHDLPEPSEGFRLKARARHILREYQRVENARDALLLSDPLMFGELMHESHMSCALDYGISCPELDMLVTAARTEGAIGARLTGAGFGGSTINLVPSHRVDEFCRGLDRTYYLDNPHPHRHLRVTSVPGASYLEVTDVA